MKKIISLLFAVVFMLGAFTGCYESTTEGTTERSKTAFESKQSDIVKSFGATQENNRIVGYKHNREYYEYIVVKYDEGKKINEKTYYVYYNMSYYNKEKDNFTQDKRTEFDDEAGVIIFITNTANTGLYSSDKTNIEKTYSLR